MSHLSHLQALHGEQYLELYRPLQPNATLKSNIVVADVLDKKSGALIIVNITTSDEKGNNVCCTLSLLVSNILLLICTIPYLTLPYF